MADIFRSERTFQVWHYTAAHHDRLLLRSTADEANHRRVDLYVESVRGLLLESLYRGIVIREGTPEEVREVESGYGIPVTSEPVYLHVIGEERMRGFIVGGPLQWHEDYGGFRDPSHFGPLPGTA
ncbi:hypothetical protein [Streptomyces glomeratus]|uniref:Uncharacterized protein n=1 Tax=Streptomyces glomeratus TaxID=284452 RepID=A0ABP6M1A4_9ACTN|nr:hypothetical protein [Streptomyces glomeratus]MCF1506905.1 hypothetical protein [Streptomyces glomeratus]